MRQKECSKKHTMWESTFFETGDLYGKGKSERLIGEVFKDMRDEIVIISTKYGYDFSVK